MGGAVVIGLVVALDEGRKVATVRDSPRNTTYHDVPYLAPVPQVGDAVGVLFGDVQAATSLDLPRSDWHVPAPTLLITDPESLARLRAAAGFTLTD